MTERVVCDCDKVTSNDVTSEPYLIRLGVPRQCRQSVPNTIHIQTNKTRQRRMQA